MSLVKFAGSPRKKIPQVVIKHGRYGLYAAWGGSNFSLSSLDMSPSEITLADVKPFLTGEKGAGKSVVRRAALGKELHRSLRNSVKDSLSFTFEGISQILQEFLSRDKGF